MPSSKQAIEFPSEKALQMMAAITDEEDGGGKTASLRSSLIRLAHTHDALRPHILGILKDAGEVPEAFKKQWEKEDKDDDGKKNEPKPDFLKSKKASTAIMRDTLTVAVRVMQVASGTGPEKNILRGQMSLAVGDTPLRMLFKASVMPEPTTWVVQSFEPFRPLTGAGVEGMMKFFKSALLGALRQKGDTLFHTDRESSPTQKKAGMAIVRRIIQTKVQITGIREEAALNTTRITGAITIDAQADEAGMVRFRADIQESAEGWTVLSFMPLRPITGADADTVDQFYASVLERALRAHGKQLVHSNGVI